MEANLLITFEPTHAGRAKEEVESLLKDAKEKAKYIESGIQGMFGVAVKDARKIVKKAREEAKKNPEKFSVTYHYTPIDKWCKTDIKEMQKIIKDLAKNIKDKEKWKLNLNKRQYDKMHSKELILKLTELIEKPNVDLDKPDKIIQVEIIGNKAGLALLGKDELLDLSNFRK